MPRLLVIILLTISTLASAQEPMTYIAGKAPGAEGKSIRVIRFSDLLTFTEETLATSPVDSTGAFSLSFPLETTIFGTIAIDFHRAELYLEPGKSYRFSIAPMDYQQITEVNPFIFSQNLRIEMINPGLNELNIWIANYNAKYDQFLLDNFNRLYLERKKSLVDTFRLSINNLFLDVDIPYYQDYMNYKTAGLEQLSKAMGTSQLANRYFNGKPILYQNTEYMQFFNTFFTKYITATSPVLKRADLPAILNGPLPFRNLLELMGKDTIVKDSDVGELVLLKGLMELYYADPKIQDQVITAANEAVTLCKSPKNKIIAANLVRKFSKLRPGSEAPDFTLPDKAKKQVSLKSLRGKPVLINFWTTYCQGCLGEMERMVDLNSRYGDKVTFVSISADREFIKMLYFVNLKKNYTWNFLHVDNQSQLLVDYDVRSYPLFVLIDRNGKIKKYPAPLPSEGLERWLDEVVQP